MSYEHKLRGAAASESWHQTPRETVMAVSDVSGGAALLAELERLVRERDSAKAQIRNLRIRR